jgi:hypothetical protein
VAQGTCGAGPVTPAEVRRVLEITDSFGIHRESVRIPLDPAPAGSLCIEGRRLVVRLPEHGAGSWIEELPRLLRELPGVDALPRAGP